MKVSAIVAVALSVFVGVAKANEQDSFDCYSADSKGSDYQGLVSTTASGRTCQKWVANFPQKSEFAIGNHNYCRNPDGGKDKPWCYTLDPAREWEYCEVPVCDTTKTDYHAQADAIKTYMGHTVDCNCGSDKTAEGPWGGVATAH
eukprot:GDKI01028326.1.p2 GENE.GDKI01028326.1~~GDKI01028326.1.p2  ORF type:complete len:145 (+),score=53.07 GDKI01028326.1:106-540(+)